MANELTTWYDYVMQQVAAESYLEGIVDFVAQEPLVRQRLRSGNNRDGFDPIGFTRFTDVQIDEFLDKYRFVHQASDNPLVSRTGPVYYAGTTILANTGLSATLIQRIGTNEFTLAIRSTEFRSVTDGGDRNRDVLGADVSGIAKTGFALAQLSALEEYFSWLKQAGKLPQGSVLNVTGYSLGGHLATVFTEVHANDSDITLNRALTFNGAGRGKWSQNAADPKAIIDYYRTVVADPTIAAGYVSGLPLNDIRRVEYSAALAAAQSNQPLNPLSIYEDERHIWAQRAATIQFGLGVMSPVDQGSDDLRNGAASKTAQLYGREFPEPSTGVANSGVHAPAMGIFVEAQPLLEEGIFGGASDFGNAHSLMLVADSLALMRAFQTLDPTVTVDSLNGIFSAASNKRAESVLIGGRLTATVEDDALENSLDALRHLFLGSEIRATSYKSGASGFGNFDARNGYHNNLSELTRSTFFSAWSGQASVVDLTSRSATQIADGARTDIAYRYALMELNPFAVTGTPGLYDQHNAQGRLELFNPVTGAGALTDRWLTDRVAFLSWKDLANIGNTTRVRNPAISENYQFIDLPHGYRITVVGQVLGADSTAPARIFSFGGDRSDSVTGGSQSDDLFGGGGSDLLDGKAGNDYLEGGAGMDVYSYNASSILGIGSNDGEDTIRDTDGRGVIRYVYRDGANVTTRAVGGVGIQTSGTAWLSADGKFELARSANAEGREDLTATVQGDAGGKITMKDFDFAKAQQAGYLALRFIGVPAAPVTTGPPVSGTGTIVDTGASDLVTGSADRDRVEASAGGDDWIQTEGDRDIVTDAAGNDFLEGGTDGTGGGDVLNAGGGADVIFGDSRPDAADPDAFKNYVSALVDPQATGTGLMGDLLAGQAGEDFLFAGAGNDLLAGGSGADLLLSGAGDDTLYADANFAGTTLTWEVVVDTASDGRFIFGVSGDANPADGANDTVLAGAGNDWVGAGRGDDYVDAGSGNDVVLAEAGNDVVFTGLGFDKVYGDLSTVTAVSEHGDDVIDLGEGDDTAFGDGGSDVLIGGDGIDTLFGDNTLIDVGFHGNDLLVGGDGNDVLLGQGGNDTLIGGPGTDHLEGGPGKDTYVFNRGDGVEEVIDTPETANAADASVIAFGPDIARSQVKFRPGSLFVDVGEGEGIHLEGWERFNPQAVAILDRIEFADGTVLSYLDVLEQGFDIEGTEEDDNPYIGAHPALQGTAFKDRIRGFGGNDLLAALQGDDTLEGGAGSDQLQGNEGDDSLLGGNERDALFGQAGNDYLDGGAGPDALMGGAGDDRYAFGAGDAAFDYDGATSVVFGPGITAADLSLRRQLVNTEPVYSVGLNGAVLDSEKMFMNVAADEQLAFFEFVDGTVLDHLELLRETWVDQAHLVGGLDSDLLEGYAGNDFLQGADGNDVLRGHRGDDRLEGGDGDDVLEGGAGADWLMGGVGADILAGGAGDDQLEGGTGDDIYIIASASGRDLVNDSGAPADFDTIRFDATRAEATLERLANGDLSIRLADGSQVTVTSHYSGSANHVERLKFSDNVTVEAVELDALAVPEIIGTAGDEVLVGTEFGDVIRGAAGADVLDGGRGDDLLDGGEGADTYLLKFFQGTDRIVEDGVETSVIQLQAGMTFAQLEVAASGDDLVLTVGDSNSAQILTGYNQGQGQTNWVVRADGGEQKTVAELIAYLDTLAPPSTLAEFEQQHIDSARQQYLTYLASFDAAGDIVINEQAPSDAATIYKDPPHYETGSGGTYFLNIGHIVAGGSANVLDLQASGLAIADGGAGDDLIDNQGAGFDYASPAISIGSFLNGNQGNDNLFGSWSADTLVGRAGNDGLYGSHGNDRYLVFADDIGSDYVDEVVNHVFSGHDVQAAGSDSTDAIELIGVDFGDVTFSTSLTYTNPNPFNPSGPLSLLTMTWGPNSNVRLVLPDPANPALVQFPGESYGVETINFADGAVLTQDQLLQEVRRTSYSTSAGNAAVAGTAGDDALTPPAPTISSAGLNKYWRTTLNGLEGNDTLTGGPEADILNGGDGTDDLSAGDGDDTLSGGTGNDVLAGGWGSDVYLFNRGDGQDTISDSEGSLGLYRNVLRFGAGISPNDVAVTEDGANLYLQNFDSGDRVTLESAGPEGLPNTGVSRVEFADATVWSRSDLLARTALLPTSSFADVLSGTAAGDTIQGQAGNDEVAGREGDDVLAGDEGGDYLQGDAGNDTLSGGIGSDWLDGGAGSDTLTGGPGDDLLLGGQGADTYIYNLGDGVDTVSDSSGPGASNTVQFGTGIASADLSLDLGSLLLHIGSAGGAIHFESFDPSNPFGSRDIDRFVFTDGTMLSYETLLARGFDITGTDWADQITGTGTVDRIRGGLGNDVLAGGRGSDTYVFTAGDGADSIQETADASSIDVLRFDAGIDPESLVVTRSGDDIVIALPAAGDQVALNGWFTVAGETIERVEFFDGSFWTAAELESRIVVGPTNHAPQLVSPLADQTATEDQAFSFTVPSNTFADEDPGDTLALSAAWADGGDLPAWLTFDAATGTFSGTPENADVGALSLRVTLTDGANASASDVFELTVANVNDAPTVANAIADQSFEAETPFVFAVPANAFLDVDAGDSLALSASLFGGAALPAWLAFDQATATFTGTPQSSDIGIAHVVVTATDTSGTWAFSDFGLVVRAVAGSRVTGTSGDDLLYGGTGDETLIARGGNDYLYGDIGSDILRGDSGNDVLQGGDGSDILRAGAGQSVLDGGAGDDLIYSGLGDSFITGGAGNDTIKVGSGSDVIAFNRGDGFDSIYGGGDGGNTLSFGGGIRYSDLSLAKDGSDLVVRAGDDDRIVLKDWYGGAHSVLNLQIILDATEEFDASASDPQYNRRVQSFDFLGLVSAFDQARTAGPGLTSWEITNALLQFHLSGADDAALGGDLAYWYGRNRTLAGISLAVAQAAIGAAGFGSEAQTLHPFSGLQEGLVKLN